ncbi:MAG: ATP phosphoribosyltransferase [Phycisphaerales bacterium]|nr:ATP phosphoribosyltransferase [Phycisphaerales bacterium]
MTPVPANRNESTDDRTLRLALPKGRMQEGVFALMRDAGVPVRVTDRGYRPRVALPGDLAADAKLLKPQNIIEMLHAGSRDLGFAGADWVAELFGRPEEAGLVPILDTGLDPVRLVAAAPAELLRDGRLPARGPGGRPLVIASEYESLTKAWIARLGLNAAFVRSFGATEVFPPEDADCIVDNTASGDTLRDNGLVIADELMRSSTRLYASPAALENPAKRAVIDRLVMLLSGVLEARRRVMLELNVSPERLQTIVNILPCMRQPTVSPLHAGSGYAVKAAVPRETLPGLIPQLKAAGGSDIVVTSLTQIVP